MDSFLPDTLLLPSPHRGDVRCAILEEGLRPTLTSDVGHRNILVDGFLKEGVLMPGLQKSIRFPEETLKEIE